MTSEATNKVLVTGGAGYVGSHTCVALLAMGYEPIVIDDLSNSHREVFARLEVISGKKITWIQEDIKNTKAVVHIIKQHAPQAVIHFAGLKAVADSVLHPLRYYHNNLYGAVSLLDAMQQTGVKRLLFSSSATVYGNSDRLPFCEDLPLQPYNPYGRTKAMIEQILTDYQASDIDFRLGILRYFNPVGAHASGLIGEDPLGMPNNLMPCVAQAAVGRLQQVAVFGQEYQTTDGTGVRDYIHVMDLAEGHVAALNALATAKEPLVVNLGMGQGYSVLEVIETFMRVNAVDVPYIFAPKRDGDVALCYANVVRARAQLNWQAVRTLEDICRDVWRWQQSNPSGYTD